MKLNTTLGVAAALALAVFARDTIAQTNAAVTRAEVKAEVSSAQKAGKLIPAGENATPAASATVASTKTREERKAETLNARSTQTLTAAGEGSPVAVAAASAPAANRAAVKAETANAVKSRKTTPAGEGPDAPAK